jgi:hypothetical protein
LSVRVPVDVEAIILAGIAMYPVLTAIAVVKAVQDLIFHKRPVLPLLGNHWPFHETSDMVTKTIDLEGCP